MRNVGLWLTLLILYYIFGFKGKTVIQVKIILSTLLFIAWLAFILVASAEIIFSIIGSGEYQYFILVIYVYLIKDLFLMPLLWLAEYKNVVKFIAVLINGLVQIGLVAYAFISLL